MQRSQAACQSGTTVEGQNGVELLYRGWVVPADTFERCDQDFPSASSVMRWFSTGVCGDGMRCQGRRTTAHCTRCDNTLA